MTGETDLDTLIATMDPRMLDGVFVFATMAGADLSEAILKEAAQAAVMTFSEPEGVTLILPQAAALALGLSHAFPCRMIVLQVHSALEAVGFLARITARLARLGMGVNPVSGFFHDHLFVPEDRADEALAALRAMAAEARGAEGGAED